MIVIIGAGPAGLAVAHHLQQRNLPFLVIERGEVGNSWRNHYDSLQLHTLKEVSHLPGTPYPEGTPDFPTRQDFLSHQIAYAKTHRFDIRTNTTVLGMTRHNQPPIWTVETTSGTFEAEKVVVASGIWSKPFVPHFSGLDQFEGDVLHANDYANAAPFVGKRVLVIGVGNTGADISVELAESGATASIAVADGVDFVPYPSSARAMEVAATLFRILPNRIGDRLLKRPDFADIGLPGHPLPPTKAYPVVGFKLPDAVRAGHVKTFKGIERIGKRAVHFVNGDSAEFDTIIMATGYRPAIDFLPPDAVETDKRGWPIVDHAYRSTRDSSLYLAGFDYPATSGWIQNMRRVAKKIGRNI